MKYECQPVASPSLADFASAACIDIVFSFFTWTPQARLHHHSLQNSDHGLFLGVDFTSLKQVVVKFVNFSFLSNKCVFCCQTNINITRKRHRIDLYT